MKQKNKKKQQQQNLSNNAVRIRCCFCDIKDTCKRRVHKERDEKLGRLTSCILTPNKPKAFLKDKKEATWFK